MSKVQGADSFKKDIYTKMTQSGYQQPYEVFAERNADPDSEQTDKLYSMLLRKRIYEGSLEQFKTNFYGVKKKPVPSAKSVEQSEEDYVNTAGVKATGSSIERGLSGFSFVREGQELSAGKKEQTLAQIKQMRTERPGATIVQVADDTGRPKLKFLEDHKAQVKSKAARIPDAAQLETQNSEQAVTQFYQDKPEYLKMIAERKQKGYENSYNRGKFVDEGITQMQKDTRNAIDIKAKEIGSNTLSQYLNLNKQLNQTPENAPEFPKLVQDYQAFNAAHPDIAEYEGLVNKFWALDAKGKEAKKNPDYADYYKSKDKKELAQMNADIWEGTGMVTPYRNSLRPAATKELFDLGAGLIRIGAGFQRWVSGKQYASLDATLENFERVADPALYAETATPSNRSQLIGQQYADVGDYKVLIDNGKVASVVTKDGGYQVRNQAKVDEVIANYERNKPKIKTQALNPYTAHDVIVGGGTQLALGMMGGGVGGRLGKAGSMMSNFGSKATTVATNTAGTYNKLYNAAIQELGAPNQKAAERYAGIAALGMSMIGTLVNPLEQQILGQAQKASVRLLAKELGEGVAEQTAVRNASRMLFNGIKTLGKEGVMEGAAEALLDDAVKFGVNKTMLKDEPGLEVDLPQDILDNVAEETLGGLFGSVSASVTPSTLQQESLVNAYKSPNRAKILAKLDKKAAKHYETVFAKADLDPKKPIMEIHRDLLVKEKTGEDYVAPPNQKADEETRQVAQTTPDAQPVSDATTIAQKTANQIDLEVGGKITTPMGQTATVIGLDSDTDDETGEEGAAQNYIVRMDESGEETVISIADYNKRIYENGITELQAQGMDRNEAEFAIAAAQELKTIRPKVLAVDNPAQDQPSAIEDAVIEEPVSSPAVGVVEPTEQIAVEPVQGDNVQQLPVSPPQQDVAPVQPTNTAIGKNTVDNEDILVRDGITYQRQKPTAGISGNSGQIEFSANTPMQSFTYKVIEADEIQSSHTNSGGRNPMHFIPEAQPKERNDKAGMAASDAIAEKIDFGRISASPNAYTGAPVVNNRGEVIQGNNRAIAIKKHYGLNKEEYRAQLMANSGQYGIDPSQIEGMKNPVLVREVSVDDEAAVELGNYDVKDLETGGIRRIDPVATSRRIPFDEKQKIASALLVDPDKTLRDNIKKNFQRVAKMLVPKFITPNQYDSIVSNRTNDITPKGVDDITELVLHFIFDGGDIKLRQIFDMLPSAFQQGVINAMPNIFSVPQSESIIEQLQNAMILLYEVSNTKSATIDEYLGQIDVFDAEKANRFSHNDIALAKVLQGKKQGEVKTFFAKYASFIKGSSDMFGEIPGVSKAEAFEQSTGVAYSPTPQDIINGASQNIQRNATGKDSGSGSAGNANARISDETTSVAATEKYQGATKFVDAKSASPRLKPLARVMEKALKAMRNYGNFNVYFYSSKEDIRGSYNQFATFGLNENQSVSGFFNPADNSIHIYVDANAASTTGLHETLHPFVRAIQKANPKLFIDLYENLKTIPEFDAVTMSGSSVRQFSENSYYQFIGSVEEEALVEFFARVGSGEVTLRKESKGKLIEWINNILKTIGFPQIEPNADVRKWAAAIAKALQEGRELESMGGSNSNEIGLSLAAEVIVDYPYYDKVAKLVELGIKKGLSKAAVTSNIQNALTSQGVTIDPAVVNAVYEARSATAKKPSKISNKYLQKIKEFHQKLFVAMGGGAIRELSERLDGTIQRHVDQTAALIKTAEKQSKNVDQDLVDRFLRNENSEQEKLDIADKLRAIGFSEENINQYLIRGTTKFQRSEMVAAYNQDAPANVVGSPFNGSAIDQTFIDATLNEFTESTMSDTDKAKVPDDLAETLTKMRMSIDNLSQYLIDEGYVVGSREDVITKNLGQYMSDVYGIFKDKKFKPTEAAKAKARKYFIQQIKQDANKLAALATKGGNLDEEISKEAERMMNDYRVRSQQGSGQSIGALVGKKSEAIFKQKKGVPDELKELLGKYSPLQEYAYTMFQLVNYVEKSKFQRRMVNLGNGLFMWNKNDPSRPEDANYELKGFASAKLSGETNPFKGMMVTKEVFETLTALDQLDNKLPAILKGFLKFQGWVNKFKTVYSYQTHIGNVIGNFFFMAFNGMADVATIKSLNTARKATGRDLMGKYGYSDDDVEEALTVLKNEGAIGNEVSVMAIRKTVGDLEKSGGASLADRAANSAIGFDEAVTNLYQAEDSFFKVLAYLTERNRYGESLYGKEYGNLSKVEKEEVNRIATDIAKSNWPNYNRMGKFTQSLAKNNVLFGNFLAFTFEAVRTYGNTISLAKRELQSKNPGVRGIGRKRMAGIIAGSLAADAVLMTTGKVVGGVFGLMFAGDDDTKLNRDLRIGVPKFLKGGDLMFTKKSTSVYTVVDISAKNPLLIFRRHLNALAYTPSDEETAKVVATQFLESFFSKPIAMKYVDNIKENDNGKGDQIWLDSDTGTERAEKIFAFTIKTIAPTSIVSAQKLIEADDLKTVAKNQLFGLNTYEIDYEQVWGYKLRDYGTLSSAYKGIRKPLKDVASDETASDSEFYQALDEYNDKRKEQMDHLIEVKQSMMNIMPGNEGDKIIENVINESGLSFNEKYYLKTGVWTPYRKSRQELKY